MIGARQVRGRGHLAIGDVNSQARLPAYIENAKVSLRHCRRPPARSV
jgi:hypothetical protein